MSPIVDALIAAAVGLGILSILTVAAMARERRKGRPE